MAEFFDPVEGARTRGSCIYNEEVSTGFEDLGGFQNVRVVGENPDAARVINTFGCKCIVYCDFAKMVELEDTTCMKSIVGSVPTRNAMGSWRERWYMRSQIRKKYFPGQTLGSGREKGTDQFRVVWSLQTHPYLCWLIGPLPLLHSTQTIPIYIDCRNSRGTGPVANWTCGKQKSLACLLFPQKDRGPSGEQWQHNNDRF